MLIGLGLHARAAHLPTLLAEAQRGSIGRVIGIDLLSRRSECEKLQASVGDSRFVVELVDDLAPNNDELPPGVVARLDQLRREFDIDSVLVATDPKAHVAYSKWAVRHRLDVLLDKPVSVRDLAAFETRQAAGLLDDYESLRAEIETIDEASRPLVGVMCQRRFHPAFVHVRNLIQEVASVTGCPVTSMSSVHSDGQWRMPNDLVELDYHAYNKGYGKASHSGYHFFDLMQWLLAAGLTGHKQIDGVEVHSSFSHPGDYLTQFDFADYASLFADFNSNSRYDEAEVRSITARHGEVDASISLRFLHGSRVMCLGSLTLLHNGLSMRSELTPALGDLYRGNGRVRQESHVITQGPFQTIHVTSLQATTSATNTSADYAPGGRDHIEVRVFRNFGFGPQWQPAVTLDGPALASLHGDEPTQTSARKRALLQFLAARQSRDRPADAYASDYMSHRPAVTLMSGAYHAAAKRAEGSDATLLMALSLPQQPGPGGP